jgi:hypothetical protein
MQLLLLDFDLLNRAFRNVSPDWVLVGYRENPNTERRFH